MHDSPLYGERHAAANDQGGHQNAPEESTLEAFKQARNLLEEVDFLVLLGRRAPAHVDAEEMAQQSLRDVQRQTAQEDGHQRDPLDVAPD